MNKRRLLKLADLLEADAKNKKGIRFDLDVVGLVENLEAPVEVTCGTTACAMGLAAVSGVFKRAGLSYRRDAYWLETTIDGRKFSYDRAAEKIFDISNIEAQFLFSPDEYPIPQIGAKGERFVAKRIRDFVAGKAHPETSVSS